MRYTITLSFLIPIMLLAQEEKSNDSIDCNLQVELCKILWKSKKYDDAISLWKQSYPICKTKSKRIFIYGIQYLSYTIKSEKNDKKRRMLVDSLMRLYDERIKYYGQEGFVNGRKGIDLCMYDRDRIKEARTFLLQSIEIQEHKAEAVVVLVLMQVTAELYNKREINKNTLDETYNLCIENVNSQLSTEIKEDNKHTLGKVKDGIENIYFSLLPVNDCDNFISILENLYTKRKNDDDWLKKVLESLKYAGCDYNDFYEKVYNQLSCLHQLPSISVSFPPYQLTNEEANQLIYQIIDSIGNEKNDTLKSKMCYRVDSLYNALFYLQNAKLYICAGLTYHSNWELMYLLADCYLSFNICNDEITFKKSMIYCLVVDKLNLVKKLNPPLINILELRIKMYSSSFPTKQEIEDNGYSVGQTYKFDDWIDETTIIRACEE